MVCWPGLGGGTGRVSPKKLEVILPGAAGSSSHPSFPLSPTTSFLVST